MDMDIDGDGANHKGGDMDKDRTYDNSNATIDSEKTGRGTISFGETGPVGGRYPNVITWGRNVPRQLYYGSDIGGTGRPVKECWSPKNDTPNPQWH